MNLRYVSLLLFVILCLSVPQLTIRNSSRETLTSCLIASSEYYAAHAPISIDTDQDFIDYGFPGNGSAENPYRLERLNITSSISFGMAVSVQNTHSYFIIRDCHIVSEYIGIALLNVAAGTGVITNNTLMSASGKGGAIAVTATNCTISENACINWAEGIHLNHASQCTISRNNVSDSTYQGINIRYSNNNTITSNRIANSTQHGLAFVGTSRFNTVYNNTFVDNGHVTEYAIDGERNGTLRSQGYDEGSNNTWYDLNSNTGNFWSDYSGFGSYAIDGPANSFDPYPNNSKPSEVYLIIAISVFFVLTLFLLMFGYRRLRR
jgi:parallel beta-helix repeat protein